MIGKEREQARQTSSPLSISSCASAATWSVRSREQLGQARISRRALFIGASAHRLTRYSRRHSSNIVRANRRGMLASPRRWPAISDLNAFRSKRCGSAWDSTSSTSRPQSPRNPALEGNAESLLAFDVELPREPASPPGAWQDLEPSPAGPKTVGNAAESELDDTRVEPGGLTSREVSMLARSTLTGCRRRVAPEIDVSGPAGEDSDPGGQSPDRYASVGRARPGPSPAAAPGAGAVVSSKEEVDVGWSRARPRAGRSGSSGRARRRREPRGPEARSRRTGPRRMTARAIVLLEPRVVGVPAEQLVAPSPPRRHRGVGPDLARDEEGRDHRRVGERLRRIAARAPQHVQHRGSTASSACSVPKWRATTRCARRLVVGRVAGKETLKVFTGATMLAPHRRHQLESTPPSA